MPEDFDVCVRNGGKVRTLSPKKGETYGLKEGQYQHVCTIHGESYYGEVKTKKKK